MVTIVSGADPVIGSPVYDLEQRQKAVRNLELHLRIIRI
jgi:hypothetical protein